MRKICMPLATALAVLALGASGAAAQSITLTADLTGGREVPNAVLTGAFGKATVIVDTRNEEVRYTVEVWNFPSGLTGSHIHVGAQEVSGPVIVDFTTPGPVSNDFVLSGTTKFSAIRMRPDQGIRSVDDAIQAILAGNAYVNVHSQVNPAGEIRGQLKVSESETTVK